MRVPSPLLLLAVLLASPVARPTAGSDAPPAALERYVAIDNVCAWPNLTLLRDGTIVATIFNQPSHGQVQGDAECWASADGLFWTRRGVPTPHDPSTNRMNVAAGLARNGDLLVLCSGWTNLKQPGRPKQSAFRDAVLPAWVCRSTDGGRTWKRAGTVPAPPSGWSDYIPFGPIALGTDGALHASFYGGELVDPSKSFKMRANCAWHFLSKDDGASWHPTSVIAQGHNETSLLHLGDKRWLAAARADAMDLYRSDDDGATWQGPTRVTSRNEINAHLAQLKDGRLLLTYGNRVKGEFGVLAKLSADEGASWGAPIRLATSLAPDCGYPSSVQRPDGRIVTAHYAARVENHDRYHMGVTIWTAPTP